MLSATNSVQSKVLHFAAVNHLNGPLSKQIYFNGFKKHTFVGLIAERFLSILHVSLFQGLLVKMLSVNVCLHACRQTPFLSRHVGIIFFCVNYFETCYSHTFFFYFLSYYSSWWTMFFYSTKQRNKLWN